MTMNEGVPIETEIMMATILHLKFLSICPVRTFGPYSLSQLKEYVKSGTITDEHYACYDRKNWVRIKDIPGFKGNSDEIFDESIKLKHPGKSFHPRWKMH